MNTFHIIHKLNMKWLLYSSFVLTGTQDFFWELQTRLVQFQAFWRLLWQDTSQKMWVSWNDEKETSSSYCTDASASFICFCHNNYRFVLTCLMLLTLFCLTALSGGLEESLLGRCRDQPRRRHHLLAPGHRGHPAVGQHWRGARATAEKEERLHFLIELQTTECLVQAETWALPLHQLRTVFIWYSSLGSKGNFSVLGNKIFTFFSPCLLHLHYFMVIWKKKSSH